MKKIILSLLVAVAAVTTAFSQAPQKFTYQAVVRDVVNNPVINHSVSVRISILQGGENGVPVYEERQTVTTNANGLMTLSVGDGTVLSGDFSAIDWANGPYFLKTETDPTGGTNYSIVGTQQLLSVPYALYAGNSAGGFSGSYNDLTDQPALFSGDYNDLTNTPQIPEIPENVSYFQNDAGYITMDSVPEIPENVSAFANDVGYITTSDLPAYQVLSISNDTVYLSNGGYAVLPAGFDGNYNSLSNRPELFSGDYNDLTNQPTLFSGDYNDLTNQPQIPQIPENVSYFQNDAGYITMDSIPEIPEDLSAFNNDAGYLTEYIEQQVLSISNDTIYLTGGSFVKLPAGFDGNYNSLSNQPELFSGDYNDLTNTPTLFSGNYDDLTNKPTIPTVPTNVSAFTNDASYITLSQVPAQVNADWNATSGVSRILNKPTLFSGSYNDLTNKPTLFSGNYYDLTNTPTIPTVPTNVSSFTNDVGYITLSQVPAQVPADWNATTGVSRILNKPTLFSGSYNDLTNKPTLFSGNYNDLTNKPTIPTVPTNVSAFANDAGYLTSATVQQAANIPTQVSAFQNDAGYITLSQVPAQVNADWSATSGAARILNKPTLFSGNYNDLTDKPTQVSAFQNDAGYITLSQVPAQVNADWNATSGAAQILNKPTLFSGNYNDLTNTPTIPTVPTNVSAFTNDAGYLTSVDCGNIDICDILAELLARIDGLEHTIDSLTGQSVAEEPVDGQPCPGAATLTDIDGNTYNTVQIGAQCWMKENLRTTKYADGTTISQGSETSTTVAYWYYPDGNSSNLYTYGLWYNWPALMHGSASSSTNPSGVQGICPTGWHVPSDAEWTQLVDYVGSQDAYLCGGNSSNIAKALSSTSGWESYTGTCTVGNDISANNATGFSAFPAGFGCSDYSVNYDLGAYFWSVTEYDGYRAYSWGLHFMLASMFRYDDFNDYDELTKAVGLSVRCLRDENGSTTSQLPTVTTSLVSDIASTSATCGGNVTDDGGASVTARGVCWSISQNPTVSDSHTVDGTGTCSFTSSIMGLTANTTYYVRAYATNEVGTSYGEEVSFTTACTDGYPVFVTMPFEGSVLCDGEGNHGDLSYWLESPQAVDGNGNPLEPTPYYYNGSSFVPFDATASGLMPDGIHFYGWTEQSNSCDGYYQIQWRAEDACGNVATTTERFNILDRTSPYFTRTNSDATFNIDSEYEQLQEWLAYPMAFDECSQTNTPVSYTENFTANNFNPGTYNVAWSSSDACGNTSSFIATLTIIAPSAPTVSTSSVTSIGTTSATCGGNVTSNGGASVTARGVCWSTTQNPTISDNHTTNAIGTGSFTSSLTGLTPNTTYYVRAYATNSAGTSYGTQRTFTTQCNTVTVSISGDSTLCIGQSTTLTASGASSYQWSTGQTGASVTLSPISQTTYVVTGTDQYGCTSSNSITVLVAPVHSVVISGNDNVCGYYPVSLNAWVDGGMNTPSTTTYTWYCDGRISAGANDYRFYHEEHLPASNTHVYQFVAEIVDEYGCVTRSEPFGVRVNEVPNVQIAASNTTITYGQSTTLTASDASSYIWNTGATAAAITISPTSTTTYTVTGTNNYGCTGTASVTVTVNAIAPTVSTNSVTDITSTTATCGGNVTFDGGATVTARGVCWSTSQNPTIANAHTTDGSGTGSFTSSLTGLTPNTTYYVRAYATNSAGTSYGEKVSFTTTSPFVCGTSTLTDVDGNIYNTVQIGNQCWMKENLRTTKYADGTSILQGNDTSITTAYWYYPDGNSSNFSTYGLMYNWKAVMNTSSSSMANPSGVQGVCPTGWHVPSDAEWTQLTDFVSSQSQYLCSGNSENITKALASTTGWHSSTTTCAVGNTLSSNNTTGFGALPAGAYDYPSGLSAVFWSATESSSIFAYYRDLDYFDATVYRDSDFKSDGISVRCLRD